MAAPALPRWKPNKDEQADLDAMNTAVTRIQRRTPRDPYFLEIPQENYARHQLHPSQRHQWTRNSPFDRNEKETLQYQTYHFYEQGKEMFEQHSTRLEAPVSNRPAIARAGTPSTGPKTKISLAAYKKKQNAATTTPELNAQKVGDAPAKQAAVKGPVERAKAETEEMLAAIAEMEPEVPAKRKEAQAPVKDLKRKRDEREQPERVGERKAAAATEDVEPAAKKAKSLEDKPVERPASKNTQQRKPAAAAITKDDVVSDASKLDEQRLPPRLSPQLSPLLPDRLSPLPHPAAMSLPPRLTPTIPPNIAKTLEAQKEIPSSSQSSVPPTSSTKDKDVTLTPSKKQAVDKITKHKSPLPPRNGFRANSGSPAVRSEAGEKVRSATSAPQPKVAQPSQVDDAVVSKAKKGKTAESPSVSPVLQTKPRLLVKLKYRKSHASSIKRILGMRKKPDKSMVAPPPDVSTQPAEEPKSTPVEKSFAESKDGAVSVKGVAQKVGPVKKDKKAEDLPIAGKRPPTEKPSMPSLANPPPAAEKRAPVAEKQPATEKRQLSEEHRHDSPAKRKKTEVPAARKESSTPAQQVTESPSGSKSQPQATPSARNNLLAVAMARDKSQDSNSTQTPPGTVNTPTIGSSGTSQPNGTTRPPSSQPSNKNAKQRAWSDEARQYEKLGKELKHAAAAHLTNKLPNSAVSLVDQKLGAVKYVESFLAFMLGFCCLDEVSQAAEPRPHPPEIRTWLTLRAYQGFVKRGTEQFPALAGLTASLSVVFASWVLEIATQYHREEGITREQFFDMQGLMTKSAIEATAKLDVDILQDSFPKSWSQRTKKGLANKEKLEVGKLDGQYKLPIGLATSPVRAARAGCAILKEWLDGEGINYALKIKLG